MAEGRVRQQFREAFHSGPAFVVRAPGRVNLLGEHVDYNDGWVLPVAINLATYLAVSPCNSNLVTVTAPDLGAQATFRLTEVASRVDVGGNPLPQWATYAAGVAWALRERGLPLVGLDAVVTSEVPRGAGLSSSAALEVAFGLAWQRLSALVTSVGAGWQLPPMKMALACQQAEVEYVGVKSGLMDQFASTHGRVGHALLLDCRTLDWEAVPLSEEALIVVADSGVERTLGQSGYNERKAQCEQAVALLRPHLAGIRALRDVSVEQLNRYEGLLPEIVRKRARHVVEECARTLKAADLLRKGDVAEFGRLMRETHLSLRDLYQVSTPELDLLAQTAWTLPGCFGARLTGAGFGGCTVNLVRRGAVEEFNRALSTAYEHEMGRKPGLYVCQAADGAGVL